MSRNETINDRRTPRVVALVAITLATLALVVAFAPLALAQTPDPGGPPRGGHPPQLTDAQRTCLTQHGITPPTPGTAKPSSPPTDQQRQAFHDAAKACGIQPPEGHRVPLTATQRACLTQHGITAPTPESAKPSSPPTDQQRQAFHDAAKACGLQPPPKDRPTGS